MHIWKSNAKRCNPYAHYKDEQGTQHTKVPPELYEEIPDPARGNDEIEYTQEINEAPYVIITPKSQEQLERQQDDKDATSAKQHLQDTDYLFLADRHDKLKGDEAQRELDLVVSREAAREVLRAHKAKYPKLP
jgi:hypothetical protein